MRVELSGFGGWPRHRTELVPAPPPARIPAALVPGTVARGNGRAYGDAAIGTVRTLWTGPLDFVEAFDATTGRITVRAGLLLSDLIGAFLPRGFFPPVVPGTRQVSLGGMVAADVHGKNHHRAGSFGDHVEELELALSDGTLLRCSPRENPEWFSATVGGMGLTGVIVRITFRLVRVETGWLSVRALATPDLAATMRALVAAEGASDYAVAWLDGSARGPRRGAGIVLAGDHLPLAELPADLRAVPFPPAHSGRIEVPPLPVPLVNRLSLSLLNRLYRTVQLRRTERVEDWDRWFFPLDVLSGWNRAYGPGGFVQYQFAVPEGPAREVLGAVLERIERRGLRSSLAVLKRFGREGRGLLSFPLRGWTLALDFPRSRDLPALLGELDGIVLEAGGRIYLAKDARLPAATFDRMEEGRLARFVDFRERHGLARVFRSHLSDRLGL